MNKSEALAWLERKGSRRVAEGMARYGIETRLRVLGVSMGTMQSLAKRLKKEMGPDARHALAAALWSTECYEARMLAPLVDDPALVTVAQMNAWAADFDSWAVVDNACFWLFDRSPLAWGRARPWAASPREFIRRAGFVLMACLALHDKEADDARFRPFLPLIERGARDERNFVKKGVSWALRSIGRRRPALHAASLAVAKRLAASDGPAARWVGKDALRELSSPAVRAAVARRGARSAPPKRRTARPVRQPN